MENTMPEIKNEELEIQGDGTENEEEAHVEYDIASYPSDFTLSGINDLWNNKDIIIPEFQREFVWNINQSSLLIESFLLGLPVPPVFFYVDKENKNLVIDGQQRILSIVFFFEGLFGFENVQGKRQVFRLTGLNQKSPYFNETFFDLDDSHQRKFRNAVLRAVNIKQLSPKEENTSIYHIFERLNTGGSPLKPQEIRNCVFRGKIVTILRELNKDQNWRKILGKKHVDKHQKDVELVLRILSLFDNTNNYEKPMKEFLNQSMKKHRNGDTSKLAKFVKLFPKVSKQIVDNLGEKPFHIRGPLNAAVLDSVFTVAFENPNRIDKSFAKHYANLAQDSTFLRDTQLGTTDTLTVRERYNIAYKILIGK
jgi:uncharacterized protein with ParB-like and HNH nuclease domain